MNDTIRKCVNEFINKKIIMEYNASNNKIITNDIYGLLRLLSKFEKELIDDINIRQHKGEQVSKNESIIKKTVTDINALIYDLKHLIK